jgi:hypothetical protein
MRIKDLTEMSIARYGEWNTQLAYSDITMGVMKSKYTFVGTVNTTDSVMERYQLNNSYEFVVGFFAEDIDKNYKTIKDKFKVSGEISLEKMPNFEHYSNILSVKAVKVVDNQYGRGIASGSYMSLIDAGYTLMGGEEQYYGARKLWKMFSNLEEYQVDIVDIATNTILETNVKLHHGEEDYDFDQRVWAYTPEKKDIRLILTKR